jgi:hypothetical protein
VSIFQDEFTVEQMVEARNEFRAMIALHATALIELVLARSVDPVLCETARAMSEVIEHEHELCSAIKAQVG